MDVTLQEFKGCPYRDKEATGARVLSKSDVSNLFGFPLNFVQQHYLTEEIIEKSRKKNHSISHGF